MLKREYQCIRGGVFTIKNGLYYESVEKVRYHKYKIKTLISEYILDLIRVDEHPTDGKSYLIFNSYHVSEKFDVRYRTLKLDMPEPFIIEIPWKLSCGSDDDIDIISKLVCAHYSSTHYIREKDCFTFFLIAQLMDKQKCEDIYLKDDTTSVCNFSPEYEYVINLAYHIQKPEFRRMIANSKKMYFSSDEYFGFINEQIDYIYINPTKVFDVLPIPDSIKSKMGKFRRCRSKIYNMLYILGIVLPSPFGEIYRKIENTKLQTPKVLQYIHYTTTVADAANSIREDMLRISMKRLSYYSDNSDFFMYKNFALSVFKYLLSNYADLFYCGGIELVVDSVVKHSLETQDSPLSIYINIANIIDRVKKDAIYEYTSSRADVRSMKIKNTIIFMLIRDLFGFHYYRGKKSKSLYAKYVINNATHEFIQNNFRKILNDIYPNFYIMDDIYTTIHKYDRYYVNRKTKFAKVSMEQVYANIIYSIFFTNPFSKISNICSIYYQDSNSSITYIKDIQNFSQLTVRYVRYLIRNNRTVIIINDNKFVLSDYKNSSQRYARFDEFMNFIRDNEEFYVFLKMFKFVMPYIGGLERDIEYDITSETLYFKIYKK